MLPGVDFKGILLNVFAKPDFLSERISDIGCIPGFTVVSETTAKLNLNSTNKKAPVFKPKLFAGWTGLEPATSAVTGQHSNQLNYQPKLIPFFKGRQR